MILSEVDHDVAAGSLPTTSSYRDGATPRRYLPDFIVKLDDGNGPDDPLHLVVEIKGWRAADTQLDRLYATDYAAERRGIYLVLWFGHNVAASKKPKAPGRGRKRPMMPEQLREGLIAASHSAQDGRVAVAVIDLERPPRG